MNSTKAAMTEWKEIDISRTIHFAKDHDVALENIFEAAWLATAYFYTGFDGYDFTVLSALEKSKSDDQYGLIPSGKGSLSIAGNESVMELRREVQAKLAVRHSRIATT